MTARSKLTDSFLKEGFTPFYSDSITKKFAKECLTKIEEFAKVLTNKGHDVTFEHQSREDKDLFALTIDNETIYLFTLTFKTFEYEIYRSTK